MKPLNMSVANTSVKVLAERGLENAADWTAAENVAQGVTRKNNGDFYMAVDTGVCGATAPTHPDGDASDGTVTWRKIHSGFRRGVNVVNDSGNIISLSCDAPAEDGKGTRLNSNGGNWSSEKNFQGAIYLIADVAGPSNVTINEYGHTYRRHI